ncbi:hypothetical protein HDU90_005845 [Geranomyces variabilis]|nr:hypothetical protein HDU90_005845 [Geranomyces variabilis]
MAVDCQHQPLLAVVDAMDVDPPSAAETNPSQVAAALHTAFQQPLLQEPMAQLAACVQTMTLA